ncbi:MAG: RIP metalloprotease RseP [Bacillota bacterium]
MLTIVLSNVPTIIAVVVVLGVLVFIHEAGHFLMARAVGIGVHEFSLGFGPRLWGIKRGKSAYNLRAVPLGGFVRLIGMDPDDPERDQPYSFARKPVLSRLAVITAGPAMNFVLAVVAIAVIAFSQGIPEVIVPQVAKVLPGYPAVAAGIKEGDRILAVDGQRVTRSEEVSTRLGENPGREKVLTVERKGRQLKVAVLPRVEADGKGKVGIEIGDKVLAYRKINGVEALGQGVQYTGMVTGLIAGFIRDVFIGAAPTDEISGPVRVIAYIGQAAKHGLLYLVEMVAFLSINVGFFNLLPIPALDGARIGFLAWEGVTRHPIDPAKENMVHLFGFGILILLMVAVTYHDILQLSAGVK